jgi:hypothetical protein
MPETAPRSLFRRLLLPAIAGSAIVLVAVCCVAFALGQRSAENVNKLFGGSDGLQVVLRAERVEAYRVAPLHKMPKDDDPKTIGGAGMLSGPVTVDETSRRELAEILRNPGTYDWNSAKGCKFDPGVVIRFASETTTIDVVFCFHCEELQVWRDGARVGGEDFDAAAARLVTIMKRIFPDDEEIQKL